MNCDDVLKLLSNYVTQREPEGNDQRLKDAIGHAAGCKRCIESMYLLFSDFFLKESSSRLSGLSDAESGPISRVCFMWWDMSRLVDGHLHSCIVAVQAFCTLAQILELPSRECQESALHGLGHLYWKSKGIEHPDNLRIEWLVNSWLLRNPNISGELKEFANNAKCGDFQGEE